MKFVAFSVRRAYVEIGSHDKNLCLYSEQSFKVCNSLTTFKEWCMMILITFRCSFHGRWVCCHQGMARPQDADEGETLQLWSVAANILNNHLRRAENGWSSILELGVGLTTPHRKKKKRSLLRKTTRSPGPGRISWIIDLSERNLICDLVLGMLEVCVRQVRSE
jgi:hypothetical protein